MRAFASKRFVFALMRQSHRATFGDGFFPLAGAASAGRDFHPVPPQTLHSESIASIKPDSQGNHDEVPTVTAQTNVRAPIIGYVITPVIAIVSANSGAGWREYTRIPRRAILRQPLGF
jgi:hypothetical protein